MRQWTGDRSIIGPTLPWTQSTPRWLQGQRCTSRDHEEGPWNKAHGTLISDHTPHSHDRSSRSRPGRTNEKLPWIQTGRINSRQLKGAQWKPEGDKGMPAAVGVIVSWLEREVTATAPDCFYASFFYWPAQWERRACPPDHCGWRSASHLVWCGAKHKLRALPQRRSMQTRRGPAPDNAFPRIQHVAPPRFTVDTAQFAGFTLIL